MRHVDGMGLSLCANDRLDWKRYSVNRYVKSTPFLTIALTLPLSFVDRDTLMRYHYGLGIGHMYSRDAEPNRASRTPAGHSESSQSSAFEIHNDVENVDEPHGDTLGAVEDGDSIDDDDHLDSSETEDLLDEEQSDDDEFWGRQEMYGSSL